MERNEEKIDLLSQAIGINNERVAGYAKAVELLGDESVTDLQPLFQQYKIQSEQFVSEIQPFLNEVGPRTNKGSEATGDAFRYGLDIQSSITHSIGQTILENCEKGEDAFRNTYRRILKQVRRDCPEVINLMQSQLARQDIAHTHIKELRDFKHFV